MENNQVIVYGVEITEAHSKELAAILQSNESFPYYEINYCGIKCEFCEVRKPSNRIWCFKKTDVQDSGIVKDFLWDGKEVIKFFVLNGETEVFEIEYQQINLFSEAISSPSIFASTVATPPKNIIDVEWIKQMTKEELENYVATIIEQKQQAASMEPMIYTGGSRTTKTFDCDSFYQSYNESRYVIRSMRDPWGADCDRLQV